MQLDKGMVSGAIGGIAGALAMTVVRTVGEQLGLIDEQLPHKIERRLTTRMDTCVNTRCPLMSTQERVLAQAEHLAVGAVFGVGYGWLHQAGRLSATIDGPIYGLLVYAMLLLGVGPALHLTRPPWHEAPMTTERRLLVHLLYGLVTGVVTEQMHQRMVDGEPRMQPRY